MKKIRSAVLIVLTLGLLAVGSLSLADPNDVEREPAPKSPMDIHGTSHHRHGGRDGHLPATSSNVRLVGKARVRLDAANRIGDVAVLGNHAYLAAFNEPNCNRGGVYVFDISDPSAPKQTTFIPTGVNSYVGEGVQAIHIDTPAFSGDILTMNNEICDRGLRGTLGGLTLVDVTNPRRPVKLVEGVGDLTPTPSWAAAGKAHMIHSVFVWDAGDRAYAVVVDDEENADVDILDITDPRRPQLIAEHDLAAMFPQLAQEDLPIDEILHHDVIVEEIGGRFVMLVSYWDGGYVKLDVTDPRNPEYLGDSDFAYPDPQLAKRTGLARRSEANAHQAEFSLNNDYILAADEDFAPYSVQALNVEDGIDFPAPPAWGGPVPRPGTVYEGQSVFVGRACPGGPAVPPGNGTQIAILERGSCMLTVKLDAVNAAGGYKGTVVVNGTGAGLPGGSACNKVLSIWFQIRDYPMATPAFGIAPRQAGYELFGLGHLYNDGVCHNGPTDESLPVEVGAVGKVVRIKYGFDGWGYLRLFSNNGGKLAELDTYAIAEGHDQSVADGHGDLTVHEVAMSHRANDLAYLSYYAGGLRVVRIVNGKLQEAGRFIDEGGNNFWGVQVWEKDGKEYVLASDRDFGLYIFEYTGPGKVNP